MFMLITNKILEEKFSMEKNWNIKKLTVKNGKNLKALILISKVDAKKCMNVSLVMDGKNMIIILIYIKLESVIKKIVN